MGLKFYKAPLQTAEKVVASGTSSSIASPRKYL